MRLLGMPHHHHHAATGTRLIWALVTTLAFVAGEGGVGWWSGSLALVSDAVHNLADALALGLAWYAHGIATRAADARRTFGYHRVGVLAALANAMVLIVIAGAIIWQSWERIHHPAPVPGLWIMATAGVALLVNLLVSFWLHGGSRHDVNLRGAYLHMVTDAASSAGVIIAGAVVYLTHWNYADPIASVGIGLLILWSSWSILSESVGILLEAAPLGLDMEAVAAAIRQVPGVMGVHDLHAWTLGSGIIACSCHILVAEQTASAGQDVQRLVAEALLRFRISHTTIQLEVTHCTPEQDGLFCVGTDLDGGDAHDHHHHAGHAARHQDSPAPAHAEHHHAHDGHEAHAHHQAHGHDHQAHP